MVQNVEERDAAAEEIGGDVNVNFVDEACFQCLLAGRCTTDLYIFVTRGCFCELDGVFYPIRYKDETGWAFGYLIGRWRVMRQDKDWQTFYGMATIPAVSDVIRFTACDEGARLFKRLFYDVEIDAFFGLEYRISILFRPGEIPVEDGHAAIFAEGILGAVVRAGDVAVEGDGHVYHYFVHGG